MTKPSCGPMPRASASASDLAASPASSSHQIEGRNTARSSLRSPDADFLRPRAAACPLTFSDERLKAPSAHCFRFMPGPRREEALAPAPFPVGRASAREDGSNVFGPTAWKPSRSASFLPSSLGSCVPGGSDRRHLVDLRGSGWPRAPRTRRTLAGSELTSSLQALTPSAYGCQRGGRSPRQALDHLHPLSEVLKSRRATMSSLSAAFPGSESVPVVAGRKASIRTAGPGDASRAPPHVVFGVAVHARDAVSSWGPTPGLRVSSTRAGRASNLVIELDERRDLVCEVRITCRASTRQGAETNRSALAA